MSEPKKIEKYGVAAELKDFGQKTFEVFQRETLKASAEAYFAWSPTSGVTAQAYVRGCTVREAIRLEILVGVDMAKVDDMKPYVVEWLADEIRKHVKEVTTAPADPN